MEEDIKKLKEEGKSYRSIAKELNTSIGKIQRTLKKTDTLTDTDTLKGTDTLIEQSDTLTNIDTSTLKDTNDYNKIGVKKLKKSDYTIEEISIFSDAPYYD